MAPTLRNTTASWKSLTIAFALIALISAGHYLTDMHDVAIHNVYRRLYYVPIVVAAFSVGWRGGVGAALLVSIAYAPHAFFMTHHHDPAPTTDKILEMVLYGVVGGLTGWLVERQRSSQRALERSIAERDELRAQLVRAGKLSALGELMAGLAHEIRNPLATILGAAEALAAEFEPAHRKRPLADLQLREIHRLDRVVSDLLNFARPVEPHTRCVDARDLVEGVIEIASHRLPRFATLHNEIPAERFALDVDPDQLTQVLLNLMINAIQAIEQRGSRGDLADQIALIARDQRVADKRFVCLGVRDRGPGIEPDRHESIFDPYTTTRPGGSGLGLSLSSRIVEAHGGFIDLSSEPDVETTFWVCVPAPYKD